jgi:hypothetical protein
MERLPGRTPVEYRFCNKRLAIWRRGFCGPHVQELARHKQIEMTVRYAHLRNDYLGETVRILDTQPAGQKSGQKSLAASGKEPENT